jgi:hypothetical protein
MRKRFLAGITVVAWCAASTAVLALNASSALAASATITVDSATDGPAVATNCAPTPVAGACTLRDAFAAASSTGADAGSDTVITVDSSITAISLTGGELGYDGGTGGAHALTVGGAGVTITQTTADRVMHSSGSGLFTISGLTLTGGNPGDPGGAIQGGGAVTVIDSALVGNHAGDGGAIDVQGVVTITRSTIADNTAGSFGGAIEGEQNEAAFVTNSTISDNTAGSIGGGLAGTGDVTLVYSTIAGNTAPTGANIGDNGGVLTSFGSVIALPGTGVNCTGFGSTTSHGFNLEDDASASCGFSAGKGDLASGTAADLASLADNGGPGPTRLPVAGSALIDAIPGASCQVDGASGITTDERGVGRPQGSGCDVGAVEVEVAAPVPVTPSAPVTPALVVQPTFTG